MAERMLLLLLLLMLLLLKLLLRLLLLQLDRLVLLLKLSTCGHRLADIRKSASGRNDIDTAHGNAGTVRQLHRPRVDGLHDRVDAALAG